MLWMLSTLGGFGSRSSGRVADPLMLLHGFVGDGVGTWGYQLEALSDAFTAIAWDCPGAGHSSAVPESFRLADYGWAGPRRAGTRRDSPHMWRGCRSALSWR
jgi:pimeloyl-ACP methyl ester carboxylesterase